MIFYQFSCKSSKPISFETEKEKQHYFEDLGGKCNFYCKNFLQNDMCIFFNNLDNNCYTFDVIFSGSIHELKQVDQNFDGLVDFLKMEFTSVEKEEIFYSMVYYDLDNLSYYLPYKMDIERMFNINGHRDIDFTEIKLKEKIDLTTAKARLNAMPIAGLEEEIERIYAPKDKFGFGVPVHYILRVDDENTRKSAVELLVNSLYANNRIIRNKYTVCYVNTVSCYHCRISEIERLYNINDGGAVVLNVELRIGDGELYTEDAEILEKFCRRVKRSANDTVTILCIKTKKEEELAFLKSKLDSLAFIEASESHLRNEQAQNLLLNVIKDKFITNPVGLSELVERDKDYEVADLVEIYENWYKNYIKTYLYPQYSSFVNQKVKQPEEKRNEHGLDDLNALIGLNKVKSLMQSYINYQIVQKARQKDERYKICRHMAFVGNPGTAKTTVARIVACIMREKGLLSSGRLIEVGRSDLVSKYVGGTAPKVKELFDRAHGDVLFY